MNNYIKHREPVGSLFIRVGSLCYKPTLYCSINVGSDFTNYRPTRCPGRLHFFEEVTSSGHKSNFLALMIKNLRIQIYLKQRDR